MAETLATLQNSTDWQAGAETAECIAATMAGAGHSADAIDQRQAEAAACLSEAEAPQAQPDREWVAGFTETMDACVADLRDLEAEEAGL
jgi:hypothetical protein